MVRLKVSGGQTVRATVGFQFHYGTIKSHNNILRNLLTGIISIPLWYD